MSVLIFVFRAARALDSERLLCWKRKKVYSDAVLIAREPNSCSFISAAFNEYGVT